MKMWPYLLILLMISGATLHGSVPLVGVSAEEYESLSRLSHRFGPKTYRKIHMLPEDDELHKIRGSASRMGRSYIEQAREQHDTAKRDDLIDQAIRWLCMAEALCDDEAWSALQGLARGLAWHDIHTELMDDLRKAYEEYRREFWDTRYHQSAPKLYLSPVEVPRGYHRIDRTWNWLERVVGISVLPSAEERIAKRVEEFEKTMALLEARRLSDASTESADSAETAETEPLLRAADGHLKAE